MSMPFYVSPEQLMKDRADFARKGIARGRSVVVLAYEGGIAVGTVEQVTERLAAMGERGLGYAIHYFPEAAYDPTGIELFEQRVIPELA